MGTAISQSISLPTTHNKPEQDEMTWRLAKGLEKLRAQVNAKWPNRSKDSDGSVGDAAHASRSSDHNPWVKDGAIGVVTAIDITHDPKGGFDSYAFAEMLLKNRDTRIKYVISNGRIGSGSEGPSPWMWRKYIGSNKHDHHCHISIKSDKGHYDNTMDWDIDGVAPPAPDVVFQKTPPTIRKGSKGQDVENLQIKLGIEADGDFGPQTELALKAYQLAHKLTVDGVCGPQCWKSIKEN